MRRPVPRVTQKNVIRQLHRVCVRSTIKNLTHLFFYRYSRCTHLGNFCVRSIAIYSWLFTSLMTIQWISAIPIIEAYSDLSPDRIELFARIEQLVSPLTLFTQLFLTYFVISFFGISSVLMVYGLLFVIVFLLYGLAPSVGIVVFAQALLRVFEYGFNKPSREIIYSQLNKSDRYKSTVFIDTFVTRFGDLSGSIFMGIGKIASISISFMPMIAIPFAALCRVATAANA